MANVVIPYAAVPNQPASSVGVNANFTEVANKFNAWAVQTDVPKTITVAHTWSVAQIWSAAQTVPGLTLTGDVLFTDALFDIGKTGATRPRDGFFSRNVTIGGALTIGGNVAVTGSLSAASLSGSLPAASLTGNFTADMLFTDALFDIGKSGATRPRDGFFSRNVTVGGTLKAGNASWIADPAFPALNTKVSMPAGGAIDFRAAADASSVLSILDTGLVSLSTGRLNLFSGNAADAPLLIPDMGSGVAPTVLTDGKLWFIGNDLWRRIGGVSKRVTFV